MDIQVTVLTPKGIVLETRTVPDDYFDTPEQPATEDAGALRDELLADHEFRLLLLEFGGF